MKVSSLLAAAEALLDAGLGTKRRSVVHRVRAWVELVLLLSVAHRVCDDIPDGSRISRSGGEARGSGSANDGKDQRG